MLRVLGGVLGGWAFSYERGTPAGGATGEVWVWGFELKGSDWAEI